MWNTAIINKLNIEPVVEGTACVRMPSQNDRKQNYIGNIWGYRIKENIK